MNTIEKLTHMAALQYETNSNTIGPAWTLGGKDWSTFLIDEAAELARHMSYEWWKETGRLMDVRQASMEAIDMLHILLSQFVQDGLEDEFIAGVSQELGYRGFASWANEDITCDYVCKYSVQVVTAMLTGNARMSGSAFVRLHLSLGMTFDRAYTSYVGKNTLNAFRQTNGYKDGTYKKIWSPGREDNQYLWDVCQEFSGKEADLAELISAQLQSKYNELVVGVNNV